MRCTRCCEDLDIKLEHLIFPERMPLAGEDFCSVHGLPRATLATLQTGAIDMKDGVVKIKHRCAQLTEEGFCSIYEGRPQICRDFQCPDNPECRTDED